MITHGQYYNRIYSVWDNLVQRCTNTRDERYSDYGGSGITLFEEWKNFVKFYEWAMSAGYADNLMLDRIKIDKSYSPDNCRWITPQQSACNRRGSLSEKTSKYKGVYFEKQTQKWRAEITAHYKKYKLGRFDNETDAAIAYNTAAMQLHGEYAFLNKIQRYSTCGDNI